MLIFFSDRDEELLRPPDSFDFSIMPTSLARVARSAAGERQKLVTNDALKAGLYDRLPASKLDYKTGRIIGAAAVGQPGVVVLTIESPELQRERASAIAAVKDIFELGADVDIRPPEELSIVVGRFAPNIEDAVRNAVATAASDFAVGGNLTFAPVPNPHEVVPTP